jgi:hypothetical protein
MISYSKVKYVQTGLNGNESKLKGNRLSCFVHVMRKVEKHVTRRVMNMNVDGWRGRGPKKYGLRDTGYIRDECE